jgi:His/Glu/Gln/Arg/opine family amino acid ABC transporter permease subunit
LGFENPPDFGAKPWHRPCVQVRQTAARKQAAAKEAKAMDFEFPLFVQSLPALARGALTTVELAALSIVIGTVIGTLAGVARVSGRPVLVWLVSGYVTVMRGVPLLVTLLFIYYGLPSIGLKLDAFTVAIVALSVTSGAYICEIVRAGIQSIDVGQMRAARSLGMSWAGAMRRIILPQAMRRVLPPITNEALTLLKNTALVSTIALADLLRAGLEVMTWQANTFSPFAGVALIYLLLTLPLVWLNGRLERRYRIQ